MIVFNARYKILDLAKHHGLPKVYDLLNDVKDLSDIQLAGTDGKLIYVNEPVFNSLPAEDQFFVLCHELLHIVYHHTDDAYFPEETFTRRELLNICQDVIINEYLYNKLGYKGANFVYLDNLSDVLIKRGIIRWPYCYNGSLTSVRLYDDIMKRIENQNIDNDTIDDLMNDLDDMQKDDFIDSIDMEKTVRDKVAEENLDEVIENLRNKFKITDDQIDQETAKKDIEKVAGKDNTLDSLTTETTKKISSKEMIKFIEQFIGTNAVIKSRHRTYSRPSRRLTLENNLVAPGYKNNSVIKRICIYLDVSGSMDQSLVSTLYNTLKQLYKKVEFDLYTFNHNIYKININKQAYIPIGGGTSIQYVLDTIKKEKQDAAIMITDCEDRFSLKGIDTNLMIYTNNLDFKSDNKNIKPTYFTN